MFARFTAMSHTPYHFYGNLCLLFFIMLSSTFSSADTEIQVTISESKIKQFQVLVDTHRLTRTSGKQMGNLPDMKFDLVVSDDGRAIPSKRGLQVTQSKYWDILFEPGSWYLRDQKVNIVLPMALVGKGENCTHQGIMIIENNSASYQIATETCQYFQFNALGGTKIEVTTKKTNNSAIVTTAYVSEINNRLPEKSIDDIGEDYPNLNPTVFSQLDYVQSSSMTAFGTVLKGTHYVSNCSTRASAFPDCSHMPLPAYSLAKSIIGGIGLMRLEALNPGVKDILVKDLVPECSAWGTITLKHLLDNTTGRYGSSQPHSDENKHLIPFLNKTSAQAKTKHVCNRYKVKKQPGEQWVYHTTDFWLLGVAMQNFWRQKYGENTDFYNDALTPLWHELGLSPLLDQPHRQQDQPLTGWGLMLLRSDIAKLASALSSKESVLSKYLDQSMFNKAMQVDNSDRGSVAGSENLRFKHGFWAWNAAPALDCAKEKWLPFMSGYGGISVVLLPEGGVYYYFSDGGVFRFTEVLQHLNKTHPIC